MDVHRCFSELITYFWDRLFSFVTVYNMPFVGPLSPLPDDIIVEILSRLPAKHVSVCRMVCRRWLELTSTYDFVHAHIQRCHTADKVLLLQFCYKVKDNPLEYARDGLFILDKEAKGKRMFQKLLLDFNNPNKNFPTLLSSCNGLLLFRSISSPSKKYYIFNPTTHERISITGNTGALFGLFYHQSSKEYRLLSFCNANEGGGYRYFLFSLEIDSLREVGTFPVGPVKFPVSVKGVLHWIAGSGASSDYKVKCESSIMTFNVETEVFNYFPHPGDRCLSSCNLKHIFLLEIAGEVCFVHLHVEYISIWILEDVENGAWVKKYVVHLEWDIRLYPFENGESYDSKDRSIWPWIIENGELVLSWKNRGVFVYNLCSKQVREIDARGVEVKGKFCALSYVKSLVSLKIPNKYPNPGKCPTVGLVSFNI